MILKALQIDRQEYGEFKGQFTGKIVFDCPKGAISINLDEATCRKLLAVCGDGLTGIAKEAATLLQAQVIESVEHVRLANDSPGTA